MKRTLLVCAIAFCIGAFTVCEAVALRPLTKKVYPTGKLEGRTLNDLYARYLGVSNKAKIQKTLAIDFQKNFEVMWQKKNARCNSLVVRQASRQLVSEYNKRATLTSFVYYKAHITNVVEALKKNIDWRKVQKTFNLSQGDANLVKSISLSFNGQDMTAYILTELMPSSDGRLNVQMLDFILKNAGKEYIEGIPAMHDEKTSFGPYQFTEYAVFSTPHEKRGASVIDMAVRAQHIPGSVILLRGDNHHRAAYLFAVYNLCLMVKQLNAKEKRVLASSWKRNRNDLFFYCATAHHNPSAARKAARMWLDNNAKYSFERSCGYRIAGYAQKTRKNLAAM